MVNPPPLPAPQFAVPTHAGAPPLVEQARRLVGGDSELLRHAADAAGGLAVNLVVAAAILAATLWTARWLGELTAQAIQRAHRTRPYDTTLQSFAASVVRYIVIVVGLVAVLQQLGVKATSVIAVLGAASLAIGLALQGALANVAAGVMLLILRPYRVGDDVVINGRQGTVKGLDLFATRLADPDNLAIFVPNAKAFGEIIVNQTSTPSRRVELNFTVDFADDAQIACALLLSVAASEARVVAKPAAWAKVTDLSDRGTVVTLRAWTAPRDYGDARSDLIAAAMARFEAAGIHTPYPHQVAVERPAAEAPRPPARATRRRRAEARSRTASASR
jgi:small conductance mechanosensitive channel